MTLLIALVLTIGALMARESQEGAPLSVDAQVAAIYDRAAADIRDRMARAIREIRAQTAAGADPTRAAQWRLNRAAMLAAELERVLGRGDATAGGILGSASMRAVRGAMLDVSIELEEQGLADPLARSADGVGFDFGLANIDENAVRAIAEDSAANAQRDAARRLGDASKTYADQAKRVFRQLSTIAVDNVVRGQAGFEQGVNDAIAQGLISGNPRQAERAIRELFRGDSEAADSYRKLGNKTVQVGKATMSLRHYASTVTRTRMREATVEARTRRLDAQGIKTVQIVGRRSVNFCTRYLGMICTIDSATMTAEVAGQLRAFPPLSSIVRGGPPFHPNCTKGTRAIVLGLANNGVFARHEAAARTIESARASGSLLERVA